jgi:hypothetical protein
MLLKKYLNRMQNHGCLRMILNFALIQRLSFASAVEVYGDPGMRIIKFTRQQSEVCSRVSYGLVSWVEKVRALLGSEGRL